MGIDALEIFSELVSHPDHQRIIIKMPNVHVDVEVPRQVNWRVGTAFWSTSITLKACLPTKAIGIRHCSAVATMHGECECIQVDSGQARFHYYRGTSGKVSDEWVSHNYETFTVSYYVRGKILTH